MSLDRLFFVVEDADLAALGYAIGFKSTWGTACRTGAACSIPIIADLQAKLIAAIQARADPSLLHAAFSKLWDTQYNLAALRDVAACFDSTSDWSKVTKANIMRQLIDHGRPFISYELYETHLENMPADGGTSECALDMPTVYAAFLHRHPLAARTTPITPSPASDAALLARVEAQATLLDELAKTVADLRAAPSGDISSAEEKLPPKKLSEVETLRMQLSKAEEREAKRKSAVAIDDLFDGSKNWTQLGEEANPFWAHSATSQSGTLSAIDKHIKTLDQKLNERKYFDPCEYAKNRLQQIICLQAAPRKKLALTDGFALSVEQSAADIATPRSLASFEDGFIYVMAAMLKLPSRANEVADRLQWLQFLKEMFVDPELLLGYAREFGIKHAQVHFWRPTAEKDACLMIKWQGKKNSRASPATEKVKERPHVSKKRERGLQAASTKLCWTRLQKNLGACKKARCMFSHICPQCKVDHPASECPKASN